MRRRSRALSLVLVVLLVIAGLGAPSTVPPAAALPLVSLVALDPSLRIHPYLQYGAQVEPSRRVRVIVQKTGAAVSSQLLAQAVGASVLEEFPFIHSLVLEVPLGAVTRLASQLGVRYVSYDAPVRPTAIATANLRTTHPEALALPAVWNDPRTPATGKGVVIAVLDSGVDASHPDLRANVTAASVVGAASADPQGHGTHVTGIIKGWDPAGRYLGVAPDADVISIRIGDQHGVSSESALLRGLQWVYEQRASDRIRIVNLSLSVAMPASPATSPVAAAVEQLWRSGVVVVASAGNRGAAADAAWYPPGNDPFIISVGALDHNQTVAAPDDRLAPFSSRGRTQEGLAKPDLVAPGRRIVAPLAAGATLAQLYPDRMTDDRYIRLSGTSMAAPMVSGAVALLLERYPALTPDQVKWLLLQSADGYAGQPDAAGVVDVGAALQRAASGDIGHANVGLLPSIARLLPSAVTAWDQVYWSQLYWDQLYWDQLYWDQLYWDQSALD
jgi:serine protease AprX